MKSSLTLALVLALVPLASVHATDVPDPQFSMVEIPAGAGGSVVFVVPDGTGLPFTGAFAPGGSTVDATITLSLLNSEGYPIVGYPPEDIWLETTEGGLSACPAGTIPDFPTDTNGQTFWIDTPEAGGCSSGEGVLVFVAGAPVVGPPLPLVFRSPDLSGDLLVNLSDIVEFTQALGAGDVACADFNNDSYVNLSDIVRMTGGIGTACN